MAVVDFSNAVLTPYMINGYPPYSEYFMALYPYYGNVLIYDSAGTRIFDSSSVRDANNRDYFIVHFSGHMTASGTEMYIGISGTQLFWKISNVTFSNGDTVDFKIKAQVS